MATGPMKLNVTKAENDGWRWSLYASNGNALATSATAYTRKRAALRSARLTMMGPDIAVYLNGEFSPATHDELARSIVS